MKRSLSLQRETLAELTSDDLGSVAAGAAALSGPTCPVFDCLSANYLCDITFQPRCF